MARTAGPNRPRRPVSGAIDAAPVRAEVATDPKGRVTGSAIRTVQFLHDARWKKTREKESKCRQLLAGELPLVMPQNFQLANAAEFAADLPSTYTRAVEQLAFLQQKRCDVKRYPTTVGQRALDNATKLEQIMTAVLQEKYPWMATCDIVQNASLCVVLTQPEMTFWERVPEFRDPPGEDAAEGVIKPRYQRDGQGRSVREVGKGFRVNRKRSLAAYEEDRLDHYANNIPLVIRAFGPQEVTPILGPGYRLDAVIVASTYLRTSEISRTFIWGEDAHMSPTGSVQSGAGGTIRSGGSAGNAFGEVELLEFWGTDADGAPYVSYCVDGQPTYYRESGEEAVLDLSPYCSRLPVALAWGQHWSGVSDPDQRALPFMWAFLQSIRQANAMATGVAVAAWWAGFPTYTTTPNPQLPGVIWNPDDAPASIDIEPLKIIETSGPVTRISGGETSPDVWKFISFLLGENEKAGPPQEAAGRGGASGFSQTIARSYAEDTQFQTLEGIRTLYEQTASFALEILTNVSREYRPVCVYYSGEVVTPADGLNVTSSRVRLELDPDLAGEQWRLEAQYPPRMSLAERQQSAELVERRLKTRRKHFEDDGDAAPERTAAEIEAEELVASPLGQTSRWALISRILGDDQMAEQLRLMTQQTITPVGRLPYAVAEGFGDVMVRSAQQQGGAPGGPPGGQPGGPPGMPLGAGGPMPPGMQPGTPQGGQMTGLGGPTSAQSALAGAVGGAMETGPINRASAAGGFVPPELGG